MIHVEIGATKAVQERLKTTKIDEIKGVSLVFCWDTHLTKIMYIGRVIHGVMQQMGYSESQIDQYFQMSGDMSVTKTHGKKSVGGINRMITDAQYFDKKLEKDTKYQWELSEYLNRDICQPEGFDAYGYPSELFKLDMERIGIMSKRKPAKVIDFSHYIGNNLGTTD